MSDNTTATTTGNGEGLTALLEVAEKQLNEGDFLKVANFLKTMHEPEKQAPRIMRVEKCKPTIKVQFKIGGIGSGYAATKMEIDVLERKTTIYHGPPPTESFITYTRNGGSPITMSRDAFESDFDRIATVYGVKDIVIKSKENAILTSDMRFESWAKFTHSMNKLNREMDEQTALALEHDGNDSDILCNSFLISSLFGYTHYNS